MTLVGASRFPVVALCSSLGGVEALGSVLRRLPTDFPAALVVAQHRSPDSSPSMLADVLDRQTPLTVRRAEDGDLLTPGHVLVTPEAKHLLIGNDDRVRLLHVGGLPPARPSADLLLCTLAVAAGPRAIAVVLTGAGHDGALGAQAINAYGGRVLIQDLESSRASGMPAAVSALDNPAAALPLPAIADALQQIVSEPRQDVAREP